ncbi:MAG: hypothetical protein LC130_14715 [Bryobacterales bacterium]|nr:hypothetical protein [Bryobacterales bacterium]
MEAPFDAVAGLSEAQVQTQPHQYGHNEIRRGACQSSARHPEGPLGAIPWMLEVVLALEVVLSKVAEQAMIAIWLLFSA